MRGVCLVAVALGAAPAAADDETPARPPADEWLDFDPLLVPELQGLEGVEQRERFTLRLGPRTVAAAEGAWWQNEDAALPAVGVPGRGWRVAVRLSHDLGFARLELGGSLSDVENAFDRGRYVDLGVSLRREWKVSRWTTLFVALGVGGRWWTGQRPSGEAAAKAFQLRFGGTFR